MADPERMREMYDLSLSYLEGSEIAALDQVSAAYQHIFREDGVNWDGIHFPTLGKAFQQVSGGSEAWKHFNQILDDLQLSGKF